MEAHQVDPRHGEWEVKAPRYRVYFWQQRDGAWASDEWQVDAAALTEAILWAEERADGRQYALYAVVPDDSGRVGLITLYGSDPTGLSNQARLPS
jgi:hypothetical protein